MLCERNAVHLADIKSLPFFDVESAPNPSAARKAVDRATSRLAELSTLHSFDQAQRYQASRDEFEKDVYKFFGLSKSESALVQETVKIFLPSVRPRNFGRLNTPAQRSADKHDFTIYGKVLAEALAEWRDRMDGVGAFNVAIVANHPDRPGSVGAIRIQYMPEKDVPATTEAMIDDDYLQATLEQLRCSGLTLVPLGDVLHLVPDIHVWTDEALYLVRPLLCRFWTRRQALRDAEHIVRAVQDRQGPLTTLEVA